MSAMEHSDPLDKISEHFKCPICLQLMKDKVLQCREGHILCEKCYSQVKSCPQCRLPLGKKAIRNRAVEKMLDELSLECPYKGSGCAGKWDRKSFEEHVQICHFNLSKFGPLVPACQNIGLGRCAFRMNRGNAAEILHHFKTAHSFPLHNASKKSTFTFRNFTISSRYREVSIVLNQAQAGYGVLVMLNTETSGGLNYLAWKTFYWRYPSQNQTTHDNDGDDDDQRVPFKVEVTLVGRGENCLKWTVSPIDIMKSKGSTSSRSYMKMPGYLFLDWAGTLRGAIKILPVA